jgi:hypothetical protein
VALGIAPAAEVSSIGIGYGVVIRLLVDRHFDWRWCARS